MSNDFDMAELRARHLYDGLEEDVCVGEEVLLAGPCGDIEAVTSYPPSHGEGLPIAVVCHPHPLYGGSMANKVVHVLADTFNEMGVATLRFNFRGVGRSRGRFDHGQGEGQDLLHALAWFRRRHPAAPVWLAGFSFGAYVALRMHRQAEAARLLLVAPPVGLFDLDSAPDVQVPWLVIQGGQDEVVSPQAVSAWVHRQPSRPAYEWMADADHFFHGRMNRLRETLKAAWGSEVPVIP